MRRVVNAGCHAHKQTIPAINESTVEAYPDVNTTTEFEERFDTKRGAYPDFEPD